MKLASYLIILNGFLLPGSILNEISKNKIIVALDGAADNLAALGIKPHLIIGDFDSIEENEDSREIWGIKKRFRHLIDADNVLFDESYIGNFDVRIVPSKNQNFTDLQKAIKFIKSNASQYYPIPKDIHIASSPGLRMDHELSSIFTLKQEYDPKYPIFLHREYQTLQYVADTEVNMSGQHYDYCGIFGMPNASMSVKNGGLEYGWVKPYDLSLVNHSSSNRIIGDDGAKIEIRGEALMVHPPMYSSQRAFFNKKRSEQLLERFNDLDRKLCVLKAVDYRKIIQNSEEKDNILCVSHTIYQLEVLDDDECILISIPKDKHHKSC